jgi:subtilisin family serine protease
MAKRAPTTDRLHPRLRSYRNADDLVNAARSQISGCVASTWKEPAQEAFAASLAFLQEGMRDLSIQPERVQRGRLERRPKLTSPATSAFVNVFIEVERDAQHDGDAAIRVTSDLCHELQALGQDAAVAARPVFQRRNFVSATVPIAHLAQLEADPRVAFVHRAEPLKLDVPAAGDAAKEPAPRAVGDRARHGRGQGVLIGIIDVGGFDFAHSDFLDSMGRTRFVSIWDQGGDFRSAPARFDYGSELTAAHLDAALAVQRSGGLLATALEPQSQMSEGSHATHVASIAAGNHGVCPEAKLAGVLIALPPEEDPFANRRTSFSDASRIAHAIEYLIEVARSQGLALSINISLGTNGGAHDGSNGISRWIDAALTVPGRAVCVAAGNAGQEGPTRDGDLGWIMGRIHTSGQIASRGLDVDLEWTVVGNGIADMSENELEIWYPAQDRITVMLQPPGSESWLVARPGEFIENRRLASGTTVSVYNELYHPTNGENYIAVYLSPNLRRDDLRGVQSGVWKVRLHGEEVRDGHFHGWVERDDPGAVGREGETRLLRFPSFFTSASNVDSHSIGSLACGHSVIAVANADERNGRVHVTSSQGPTRDGRLKPDIAASGTDVIAANGFAPNGEAWVRMTGTSMASPYVAGVTGLMLAANGRLTAAQCASILRSTAQPLAGASYAWRNDAGFGCVAPERAIDAARSFGSREEVRG